MATSTQITQIRRLVPGSTVFSTSTATVGWYVDQGPNLWYSAALLADACGAHFGAKGNLRVGDLSVGYGGGSFYRDLARNLRIRGSRGAVPFAGGITDSDKDVEITDSDRPAHAFAVGMHDDDNSTGSGY